jgi:hypothetical protein
MAVLKFVCPVSDNEVDTGLDLDPTSFAGLRRDRTDLSCPHCPNPHRLATVQAWLGELQPEASDRSCVAVGLLAERKAPKRSNQ